MLTGGIVLCGGQSTRMGLPKALLPFGSETMLQRVVRLVHEVVEPIVVVSAVDQPLPLLAPDVLVACDEQPDRGPLEGLTAGLRALEGRAEAAFVTSCDVPLLSPAFVRRMVELLEDYDAVVPLSDTFLHPLAAVYRLSVLRDAMELLGQDRRRPLFLLDRVRSRRVPVESLRAVDPELYSLENVNFPQDYLAALRVVGLAAPPEILAQLLQ